MWIKCGQFEVLVDNFFPLHSYPHLHTSYPQIIHTLFTDYVPFFLIIFVSSVTCV